MHLFSMDLLIQLTCYGLWWVVFIAIAAVAIWHGGFLGMVGGQVLIAMMIVVLDMLWIRGEMSTPDWDGVPDQDAFFYAGVLIRVVLVNAFLLPVCWMSSAVRSRFNSPHEIAFPGTSTKTTSLQEHHLSDAE